MHTYTINSSEYISVGSTLFRKKDTITAIEELKENTFYLVEDQVGTFNLKSESISYSAFDAVFHPRNTDFDEHYSKDPQNNVGDTFDQAVLLERVIPDELEKCPECGSAAGKKSDPDTPSCFDCGHGLQT